MSNQSRQDDDENDKNDDEEIYNEESMMISSFRRRRPNEKQTKKKDEQLLKKLSLEEYFSIDHNDDTMNMMLQEIKEQQGEEANKEEGNDHNDHKDHKSDKSNDDDDDSDNDDEDDDHEDISITDHNEEGINNIMMTSFEEEIGLNEAMLESLHVKLLALEEEIEQEKNAIKQCTENIDLLSNRQNQLRSTRETNISLMKNVTMNMNKCIIRLKKKLDEINKTPTDANQIDNKGDENKIHNDTKDANNLEGHCSNEKEIPTSSLVADPNNSNADHPNPQHHQESLQPSISIPTPKYIFDKAIQIQSRIEEDTQYMQKIWSQNHPSSCQIFQHSPYLPNAVFPLHPPMHCQHRLQRMIQVAQDENRMRRNEYIRNNDIKRLQNDYKQVIKGTCLDIYACCQYEPFFVSLLPKISKKGGAFFEDEDNDIISNESKDSLSENDDCDNNESIPFSSARETNEEKTMDATNNISTAGIDPNKIICKYELFSGSCHDPKCPYQHLNEDTSPKIKRIVRKKGRNKLTVNIKQISSQKRILRARDIAIQLPSLNLPLLPSKLNISESVTESRNEDKKESDDDGDSIQQNQEDSKFDDNIQDNRPSSETLVNNKSINSEGLILRKRKADEISTSDDNEEDFIGLPSQSDINTNDDDSVSSIRDEHKFDMLFNEVTKTVDLSPLYHSLAKFNFEVRKKENEDEAFEVLYIGHSNDDGLSFLNINKYTFCLIDTLKLLADAANAFRLCVFSGRLDLCRGIMELCKLYLDKLKPTRSVGKGLKKYLKEFKTLAGLIFYDMTRLCEGYFCGRGSISYINDFNVQLGLTLISYFIRSYQHATMGHENRILPETEKMTFVKMYKRLIALIFGMNFNLDDSTTMTEGTNQFTYPYHLLPPETTRMNFTSAESKSIESFVKIYECFYAGQKLAKYFTHHIYSFNEPSHDVCIIDAQVILDDFIHPLCNLLQNHIFTTKSSVAADIIDSTLKGHDMYNSVGSPTQLCTFALFGPSFLALYTGVFMSTKKERAKSRNCFKSNVNDLDFRQKGILMAAKNMIMSSIQYFDQSGITGETLEGQLLLCPLFSMMTNILIHMGSYSKAQVLLENAISGGADSSHLWSIYSESLWSSLLQLRMSFPDSLRLDASPRQNILPLDLIQYLSLYPAKLTLSGDSSLVLSSSRSRPDHAKHWHDKKYQHCSALITERIIRNEILPPICITFVHDCKSKQKIETFPLSILLVGHSIANLTYIGSQLKTLPLCFGKYLGNLKDLSLVQNQLTSFPQSMGDIKKLEKLDISKNRFQRIPEMNHKWKQLRVFRATENMIHDVSPLMQNKAIRHLDLRSNPLQMVPVELPLQLKNLSNFLIDEIKKTETVFNGDNGLVSVEESNNHTEKNDTRQAKKKGKFSCFECGRRPFTWKQLKKHLMNSHVKTAKNTSSEQTDSIA